MIDLIPRTGVDCDDAHIDDAGEECISVVALILGLVLVVCLVLALGGIGWMFAKGIGLAIGLPFVRGERWQDRGDHAHWADVAVFLLCVLGFFVLFIAGVLS